MIKIEEKWEWYDHNYKMFYILTMQYTLKHILFLIAIIGILLVDFKCSYDAGCREARIKYDNLENDVLKHEYKLIRDKQNELDKNNEVVQKLTKRLVEDIKKYEEITGEDLGPIEIGPIEIDGSE